MHDIFINCDKCKLITINPKIMVSQRFIIIGQEQTIVRAIKKEVQYLGIWIASKQSRKCWTTRLKNIVKDFLKTYGKKSLRIGHIAYLINRVLIPCLIYTS